MKLPVILVLLLLLGKVYAQESKPGYQLLWEIKDKKTKKTSYIFGSMHSNDPRLFQFPDSLYSAFVSAEAVVLETDVTALYEAYDVRLNVTNFNIFDVNTSFHPSHEATKTVYGDEDGRPQFLDAYFQQTAHCAGKQFFQLETLSDQSNALNDIAPTQNGNGFSDVLFSQEKFTQTYLEGDISALSKMLHQQLKGTPGAYDALITKRNKKMVNGLDSLLPKFSVFCVVGSGHLYGSDGILQLLNQKGYAIRAVNATYKGTTEKDKKQMLSWRNYRIDRSALNFSLVLSGKPYESNTDGVYHLIYQELGQGNTYELYVYSSPIIPEEIVNSFIRNDFYTPIDSIFDNNIRILEGLVKDHAVGYQWKRYTISNGRVYEMTCYGGNKFMHSNRAQHYFDRLINY